jgi:hypothetical protein
MDAIFSEVPEWKKTAYAIACHCGDVRGTVLLRPLEEQKIVSDNCSICTKNGYLMAYALRRDFTWAKGYEKLVAYRCASKTKDHKFCPCCGSSMILDFNGTHARDIIGLNVVGQILIFRWYTNSKSRLG